MTLFYLCDTVSYIYGSCNVEFYRILVHMVGSYYHNTKEGKYKQIDKRMEDNAAKMIKL